MNELKRIRFKDALKYLTREKESKESRDLRKKAKSKEGNSRQVDLIDEEVKKERAKLALKRFREEREKKRHLSKERALKLQLLQKTAQEKLKKAIKYKFISKEKVQDMTESQLHKFEQLGIRANDESFQLDVPQHIYDQDGIKDLSEVGQTAKLKKEKKREKKKERKHRRLEEEEEIGNEKNRGDGEAANAFLETEMKLQEKKSNHSKKHKWKGADHQGHHKSFSRRQELRVASYTLEVFIK